MRFYIADCHFWHEALNNRMDHRGFASVEEMNTYMIAQWNRKVRKKDEVVILGDFSLGDGEQTNEILRRLNGKNLWLVTGNHDRRFLRDKSFDPSRFQKIEPYLELHDNNRHVICCHYPIMEYNKMYRVDKNGAFNTYMLYGHVHNTASNAYIANYRDYVQRYPRPVKKQGSEEILEIPVRANLINCFCMRSDYMPLTLDEWIALDEEQRLPDSPCPDNGKPL